MKKYAILIICLLLNLELFSQTKIDDYVTVEMPGTVQTMDTVTANGAISTFYSTNKTDSYLVMRMAIMSNGKEVNSLPKDLAGLDEIYNQISTDQIESMGKKGFILLKTQKAKIKDYLAVKITYKTAAYQNESGETLLLCLNGVVYVFTYSRVGDYIVQNKNKFQQSLKINDVSVQRADGSIGLDGGFSVTNAVIYGVLIFVLIIFFVKKTSDKSKLGINLSHVYCPTCQTKQPIVRKPLNQRQALYGGYTCNSCNTEMDKYGVAIKTNDR